MHSDQKYIIALVENDTQLLKELYSRFSGKVVRYVQQNSGSEDDAKDIIQEVLLVIYRQASEQDFVLTCPFDAYFFLLCKRKWLNKLKNRRPGGVTIDEESLSIHDESEELAAETALYEAKNELFREKFEALSDKCKELLSLSVSLKSLEEVANTLGVTYGYVRKKKSLCMGKLAEMVQLSEIYKDMKGIRDHESGFSHDL